MRDPADAIILLVDDNTNNLGLLEAQIEHGGFRHIDSAMSGDQAIEYLTRHTPDLIILDVMMPVTDGIQLCKIIRTRPDTRSLPVLILSARGDAESVMRGMEAGANDFLPKPILHHDLVAKVRAILAQVTGV